MQLKPEVLDIEIDGDFCGTIRALFIELALKVWNEEARFDGKRPWGNGGWKYDVYVALIAAGAVPGSLDEYDCVVECDREAIDRALTELIVKEMA